MRPTLHRLLAAAFCLATCATPAIAQNTVSIEGTVRSAASPIGGAQVTVVNPATLETSRTTTRANGEFRVLGLFPGQYNVTVRSIGYKPEQQSVNIGIGQRARLEFALEQGAAELAVQTVLGERVKQVEVQRLSVSSPVMKE
jgi:hypothetical protein